LVNSVSVQALVTAVSSLVTGLTHVNAEIVQMSQLRTSIPKEDRFVVVMQVRLAKRNYRMFGADVTHQPFVRDATPSLDALHKMTIAVEADLRSLLAYYGESVDTPEAPKPEDFFAMICSFSQVLQVWKLNPVVFSALLTTLSTESSPRSS
jgi:diaphanous 1